MYYDPHVCTIDSGVCDLVMVYIFTFEEGLVVVLSGWQSNWLCCFWYEIVKKEKLWVVVNSHDSLWSKN